MKIANMLIPFVTFGAPLAGLLFFALRARRPSDAERRAGIGIFTLGLLVAAIGVIQFADPVKLEFLLPLSTDSSGYFDPALRLRWIRFVWIFLSSSVLAGVCIYDGESSFAGPRGTLRFLFLLAANLFLSLAYLSENVLLSLMFVEITVFLLHTFSVELGGDAGEGERISYFKRNSFIVLGFVAMLVLTATNEFTTNAVVLLGIVLYAMSMILSKHNFGSWRDLSLAVLQAGTVFFLLSLVTHEEMSNELWLPLSILFALATTIFAVLSFLAADTLNAAFWILFGIVTYMFFLRFSSPKPSDVVWSATDAMSLLSCYALSLIFRFGADCDRAWKKALWFALAGFLLAVISGVIPIASLAVPHADNHEPIFKMVAMGLLTFLLSLVCAKALVVSFRQQAPSGANGKFAMAALPAVVALVIALSAAFRAADLFAYSSSPQALLDYMSDASLLGRAAALLAGGLVGGLLGVNTRLLHWAGHHEKRMEELFPRIDPALIRWNQAGVEAPERGLAWLGARFDAGTTRWANQTQSTDRALFAERIPGGFLHYGSWLSQLLRFLHSGSVRFYFFFATIVTAAAAMLFLLGGR